jgi:hypothetical protein
MRIVGRWMAVGIVVLCSTLLARDGFTWGDAGHQIICEIAFQELNPQAKDAVKRLIVQDQDFSLFSKACTWPDHPRKRPGEHFVNLLRAAAQIGDNPCPVDTPCLLTAIDADFMALSRAGATDAEKLMALKLDLQ